MKKILSIILLAVAVFGLAFSRPALAADKVNGAQIFSANCNACHIGGNNIVMAQKTLKKDALEKYGMDSMDAIVYQVTNGKGAMPRFGGRLNADQIEKVAAYVLEQAEKGW
ncbi:MAG: c-type cytochrome [Coleofasciculus sp. G3-WIS-01]|uniref:cytochrome c6 PetJ n=1 Tax=Coleofasciculus sp. G3-WIS-01 TaxID=3069528 RepID=UPI0032F58B61